MKVTRTQVRPLRWTVAIIGASMICTLSTAQQGRQAQPESFQTDVPPQAYDIVLARPTTGSVTLSILAYQDVLGQIVYGTEPGNYVAETPPRTFMSGEPAAVVLSDLRENARYYYRFRWSEGPDTERNTSPEHTFHTARARGSTYTFTITADSHLDERTVPALYELTMRNALADRPDFHIDLGDTFMTGRHGERESAARQYLAQRYYFGLLCHSAPLFLALGNHDGEAAQERDGTADSLAVWANTMRKRYFPNPGPDRFYRGNDAEDEFVGLLENYYAWEWGDALFIVLDPYWPSPRQRRTDDNWVRTLGEQQYHWLQRTLEQSDAAHRFVFIHQLVGGTDRDGRGGIEVVPFYEWGGLNGDGTDGFAQKRPGWAMPIHRMLVEHGVSVVFQGHDHLFVKQELDGIVYQTVPQPGWHGRFNPERAEEYGYLEGDILGSSGHLRVTVAPEVAVVDYLRAVLPDSRFHDDPNASVVHSYSVTSD